MVTRRCHGVGRLLTLAIPLAAALALPACATEPPADDKPPSVTIHAPTNGASFEFGTTVQFNGSGTDPEDGTLAGSALGWRSAIQGHLGTGGSINRNDLQPGQHEIRFTGVDSKDHFIHAFVNITILPPNQPPIATILSPQDGAVFQQGEQITFAGSGSDPEDGPLSGGSLVWSSSRDGQLGTGTSLSRSNLSAGAHQITLNARDSRNASQSASVTILVNAPPSVSISSPAPGSVFASLQAITFAGAASDPEDGALSGTSLVWRSSIDGQIGTGPGFVRTLSSGTHSITLTATDSRGASTVTQVSITVAGNQPPAVQITSPAPGSTFPPSTVINFSGNATDPEDGMLTGAALVWTSSIHGQLGTGTGFLATLGLGQHVITLEATDNQGTKGSAQITVFVQAQNQPPDIATIASPGNGAVFVQGDPIIFTGSGHDPEEGNLTGLRLTWQSSINGFIGTGTSFSLNSLSVGAHTITLRATDSQGLFKTASVQITVEAAVSFANDIVPMLQNPGFRVIGGKCTDCHFSGNGGGAPPFDGSASTIYSSLSPAALLCKVTNGAVFGSSCTITPADMRMFQQYIDVIQKWFNQGAKNN
jgi:hypothetical protein